VTAGSNVFLAEATISPAICPLLITPQMFEVQLDQSRIVEIGRKVVSGARLMPAHADNSTPHLGRQLINMFRIPGIVVANLTATSECEWLIANYQDRDPGRDRRTPPVK
jgi:hypothetical protein